MDFCGTSLQLNITLYFMRNLSFHFCFVNESDCRLFDFRNYLNCVIEELKNPAKYVAPQFYLLIAIKCPFLYIWVCL